MLCRTLGDSIQIETIRPPDLWFTSADPSQIGDALLNLALNARDAMPHGGRLRIEARNLHLDAQSAATYSEVREGDYVVLTVTDTGAGMPPSVMQRAIEPFFTTKPPSVGSGLGLSMAYGFAKQSGGHLDIESSVGVGTKVSLYLPRSHEPTMTPQPPGPANAKLIGARRSETVLLVDDNRSLIEVTRRHLVALGYNVVPAIGAASAMAILESTEAIDLLLTDIIMPEGMSGHELAAAARQLRPGLGVLLTTGYSDLAPEGSESHVLRKPYDRHALASAVRAALDELTMRM
jgi:CheY-like chemotaxis protein